MGTKDIETAIFFDDDRRYADLLNGYIFDGKQVIMEKQLYSQDTRETGKSQKDSWGVQKRKKIQRFRDGVKRVVGHIAPEAQVGGPIAYLRTGDMVTVDQDTKEITMHVPDEELAKRKAETELPPLYSRGVLGKYAHIVSSASRGAVTDFWNMDKSGKA